MYNRGFSCFKSSIHFNFIGISNKTVSCENWEVGDQDNHNENDTILVIKK